MSVADRPDKRVADTLVSGLDDRRAPVDSSCMAEADNRSESGIVS